MTFWFTFTSYDFQKIVEIARLVGDGAFLGTDSFSGLFYLDVSLDCDIKPVRELIQESGVIIQKEKEI